MGSGVWTTCAYDSYMEKSRGIKDVDTINTSSMHQFYTCNKLADELNPRGVKVRECRDSEEHPNTIPVILALDVTGSMGSACAAVARQLDKIMKKLYEDVQDVEFMVMGIGDFAYDDAPLQVSQFESDVRICDQLGKVYFEGGGGGNSFESYSAAWYFALHHTDLDCWKRGQKGIIITMGDEPLNPYLPKRAMRYVFGNDEKIQDDVETIALYKEASEKFDIYHIIITDDESCGKEYLKEDKQTWGKILDGQHLMNMDSTKLPDAIHDIVMKSTNQNYTVNMTEEGISW